VDEAPQRVPLAVTNAANRSEPRRAYRAGNIRTLGELIMLPAEEIRALFKPVTAAWLIQSKHENSTRRTTS
jgi:hypothetical protein